MGCCAVGGVSVGAGGAAEVWVPLMCAVMTTEVWVLLCVQEELQMCGGLLCVQEAAEV